MLLTAVSQLFSVVALCHVAYIHVELSMFSLVLSLHTYFYPYICVLISYDCITHALPILLAAVMMFNADVVNTCLEGLSIHMIMEWQSICVDSAGTKVSGS